MKLKVHNFKKIYKNHIVDINNLEFNTRITYLIGENGSGKSTLLKAIAGLISYQGEIDVNLTSCYLAENPSYPNNITVISFLRSLNKIDNTNLSVTLNLLKLFNIYTKVDELVQNLSKGMLQKINLIQCLIQNKDLFLLDEPFSGLDKESKSILIKYLSNSKKRFIISTHQYLDIKNNDIEVITIEKHL